MPDRRPGPPLPLTVTPSRPPEPREARPGDLLYMPLTELLPLVASDARTLTQHAGPCTVCSHAMLSGERVADLPSGATAHTKCIVKAPT